MVERIVDVNKVVETLKLADELVKIKADKRFKADGDVENELYFTALNTFREKAIELCKNTLQALDVIHKQLNN